MNITTTTKNNTKLTEYTIGHWTLTHRELEDGDTRFDVRTAPEAVVNIYLDTFGDQPTAEISWSSIGSVDAEKALEVAAEMNQAVYAAAKFETIARQG